MLDLTAAQRLGMQDMALPSVPRQKAFNWQWLASLIPKYSEILHGTVLRDNRVLLLVSGVHFSAFVSLAS